MIDALELQQPPLADKRTRSPAFVLVICAAIGILADRGSTVSLDTWLLLAVAATAGWCLTTILWRSHRIFPVRQFNSERFWFQQTIAKLPVALLLFGWIALFGGWHHWRWSCRAENDLANFARAEPRLVRLTAKVFHSPWLIRRSDEQRPAWQSPVQTSMTIDCRSLGTDSGVAEAVSGLARLSVQGELPTITVGDLIEITGELSLPLEPANPGDFDQRQFLRAQGIGTVVRCDHAECVQLVAHDPSIRDRLLNSRAAIRQRAEQLIAHGMRPDTAPVAQAMLIGTRAQIDEDTRRAFRETGMLHILAISGMNVGLLWMWLWRVCRATGRSSDTSIKFVLLTLPAYALITDANPPIVRATVAAMLLAFGRMIGRHGSMGNSLSLAALAVLAWNPSDLFNTGAQLSFLAVFAILHTSNWLSHLWQQFALKHREEAPLHTAWWQTRLQSTIRSIVDASAIGLVVWLFTSPLIAREFHLVSPVGSLLTVLLVVPVGLMFWIGYTFLLLGLVLPSAFGWLGTIFDQLLRWFLWIVQWSANTQLGHIYVPAPPIWWTLGFYALTIVPLLLRQRHWGRWLSVRAALGWMVIGLAWGLVQPSRPGLTCTFISVGHGLSILIECPNGRSVLYDAGGMSGGQPIARTISQSMWSAGITHLDAVVLSHADGDHCNAIPELSRVVAPREMFVHASFLDWNQPTVAAALERSANAGTKVRLVGEGQALVLDPTVAIDFLHPPVGFRSSQDNPNSLVACLRYAGRTILLTGDLELDGLSQLLKSPPLHCDVLLSPHHGSLKANSADLARWATPDSVVVSTSDTDVEERLSERYGPAAQIITTARYGAVRCQILPDGDLQLIPFKTPR